MDDLRIKNYPLVIEPTVTALELLVNGERVVLPRVATAEVLQEVLEMPAGLAHFFGNMLEAIRQPFLLAYGTSGRLTAVLHKRDDEWVIAPVPEEAIGDAVALPSVRLTFKTARAREGFLSYLAAVTAGRMPNTNLAYFINEFASPPALLEVWKE